MSQRVNTRQQRHVEQKQDDDEHPHDQEHHINSQLKKQIETTDLTSKLHHCHTINKAQPNIPVLRPHGYKLPFTAKDLIKIKSALKQCKTVEKQAPLHSYKTCAKRITTNNCDMCDEY